MSVVEQRRDLFRTAMSVLIATVTVVGALVGWRISVASGATGAADSKGLNAALQAANAGIGASTHLSMNLGFFATYREHLERATLLDRDAEREADAERRTLLLEDAARERNLAATARAYVDWDYVTTDPEANEGVFDGNRYWAASWAEAAASQDLDDQSSFARADRTRDKARGLTLVAVALSATLFLLTAAMVARRRATYLFAALAAPLLVCAVAAAIALEVLL